jgi:arabinogalactan oligomer/maltooligosaccharide transport system permease protein
VRRLGDVAKTKPSFTAGLVVKLILLGGVNALVVSKIPDMVGLHAWFYLTVSVMGTLALDVVYLTRRRFLPGKYLIPATIMLFIFAVYPVVYTVYVSFTNYSADHFIGKQGAVAKILGDSEAPLPDAPRFETIPMASPDGTPALLLTDSNGDRFLGTGEGLEPADPEQIRTEGEQVMGYGEFGRLSLAQLQPLVGAFRVPVEAGDLPADPEAAGSIRLATLGSSTLVQQNLQYDPGSDTIRNIATGEIFREKEGFFVGEDGNSRLTPGWRVLVGFDNFQRVFTSPAIRGPFLRAFVWNYVFATLTVLLQFSLGLGIALALNHPLLRLKRIYRSLLVVPFALPSYMTALIWAGLLNREFGQVNQLLGADINWLRDPTMAKVSILLVTMWLGFPYFFLVSTGALTSIPAELTEAAAVDGASAMYSFRTVRFPLLLTTLAPLLIASFAYNFNNFNAIYLLTQGGPPIQGAQTPAGHTDILITYTYRLAFESGRGANYAFAAAISILIFVMIMAISAASFRYSKALEQVR